MWSPEARAAYYTSAKGLKGDARIAAYKAHEAGASIHRTLFPPDED